MVLLIVAFCAQVVVISIIVFVLKKTLDQNLMDGAIRHIEYWALEEKTKKVSRLVVQTHKPLDDKYHQRIVKAANKNFGSSVVPDFRIDTKMMGGMIIWVDDKEIEYSLRDRLKQAFPVLRGL